MTTFQVEQTYSNYINGEWVKATSGETEPSINPANRKEVVGYVPTSGVEDLNRAVAAAKEASKRLAEVIGCGTRQLSISGSQCAGTPGR